jgi:hypothetical protein
MIPTNCKGGRPRLSAVHSRVVSQGLLPFEAFDGHVHSIVPFDWSTVGGGRLPYDVAGQEQ